MATYLKSSIEKIHVELAWVNETPDPNKCGCRNVRCCEETGHKPGAWSGMVATKFWTFRWEYYRAPCREYGLCGSKAHGYIKRPEASSFEDINPPSIPGAPSLAFASR